MGGTEKSAYKHLGGRSKIMSSRSPQLPIEFQASLDWLHESLWEVQAFSTRSLTPNFPGFWYGWESQRGLGSYYCSLLPFLVKKIILVKVSKAQMLLTEKSSIPVATPLRNGLAILEEPGGTRAGPLQGGQQEPYSGQSDRM